jgi:uncharacterized protein YbjT (DUF2867 family)
MQICKTKKAGMEKIATKDTKILVTGASGLSGKIITNEFIRQNIPLRILVRNKEKVKQFLPYENLEVFEGDLLKPETYKNALAGIDRVLLISSAVERMTETQQTFIDTANAIGVPHIIKFSGADSGIGFLSHKFIAQKEHEDVEDYLINSGVNWTIIRPSQFMQMYLPKAPTGVDVSTGTLTLPIKKAKLSPVDIEDVARVCVKLLTENGHQNKIYEMTGPDALDMQEACNIISAISGCSITYTEISLTDYESMLLSRGIPKDRVSILIQISKQRMKCMDSHIKLDTHRHFNIRPTNFAEFIYKNIKSFSN